LGTGDEDAPMSLSPAVPPYTPAQRAELEAALLDALEACDDLEAPEMLRLQADAMPDFPVIVGEVIS
jgi:hypothetical protein